MPRLARLLMTAADILLWDYSDWTFIVPGDDELRVV